MDNDKSNESHDAAKAVEFYLGLIRRTPNIFSYWRTCATCCEWFQTMLTIAPDGTESIYFCSTQCQWDYEDATCLVSLDFQDDERISYALIIVEGIPTEYLKEHFAEIQANIGG